MCMIAGEAPVLRDLEIGGTNLFVRGDGPLQHLVYSMNVAAAGDVAMILPLPVPQGTPDDGVRFVDLSGYPQFFPDLNACFPPSMKVDRGFDLNGPGLPQVRPRLKVHRAGDFEASFVPSLADLDRLDPRFRFDPAIWDALPAYADWGFAVFQLRGGTRGTGPVSRTMRTIHPMALTFPRRDPERLFLPTLHVHDGTLPSRADFDHVLFWQNEGDPLSGTRTWFDSHEWAVPEGPFDPSKSAGLVVPDVIAYRKERRGRRPNSDHWVVDGKLVT